MKLVSTNNNSHTSNFLDAVVQGLAPDGGLFVPQTLPKLPATFFERLSGLSIQEIAFEVTKAFLNDELSEFAIKEITENAITFDAPLVELTNGYHILELFHGPTLAFKDFAARFMAQLLSTVVNKQEKKLDILVATSGDTGGAVASGFYNVDGIQVTILYPSGGVSPLQEKQLTALGGNIRALEVMGTFDDCQAMVKKAFLDLELTTTLSLTSANSINIARLIPQTFYYFRGYAQVKNKSLPTVFSVPSGNFGNATAGLIAKKMGLPYHKLVISTNANDIVPQYLDSGEFTPRASVATISNAMDIGNPSNFARIINLYLNREQLLSEMSGASFSDDQTREAIKKVYHSDNYILDPHTAVAYLGLNKFYGNDQNINKIALSTAHPSKFVEIVQDVLKIEVEIPERLACLRDKKKVSTVIKADYQHLKDYLLS